MYVAMLQKFHPKFYKGCSRNYPQGEVGHRHCFALWGEGVLLTMCPRDGGLTCPGGQGIFDP